MTNKVTTRARVSLLCAFTAGALWAASPASHAATIGTVGAIPGANDGSAPEAPLTELDGKFYGTAYYSGSNGTTFYGTVFQVDLKSGAETTLHNFDGASDGSNPVGGLTAFGGKLYGTTTAGGSLGGGTVFAIDPATGAEQVLFNLPAQSNVGNAPVVLDGLLYGTGKTSGAGSSGFIYSIDPVAGTGQIVYDFTDAAKVGATPSGLTVRDVSLYGVTYLGGQFGQGTLFRFDSRTQKLRTEHSFGGSSDGSYPTASLTNVGGVLYGTTSSGGQNVASGTVFSFDPATEQEIVLHSFHGPDGRTVVAGLLSTGGLLYGTTENGGANSDSGVLFSVDPADGQTTTVYNFGAGTSEHTVYVGPSAHPTTNLIAAGGLVYGTLEFGGAAQGGVIYSLNPATADFNVVHNFAGPETSTNAALLKVGGSFYGTASGGGAQGLGSVYEVDTQTGAVTTLHSFSGPDGARPMGALVDVGGVLYGTTSSGGDSATGQLGTVFGYDVAHRRLTTLYHFTGGADGGNPSTTLAFNDGALYGTTDQTIYKIDLSSGIFSTAESFAGTQMFHLSNLIAANGLLYGEAYGGYGTLYRFDPASGQQTVLYSFQGRSDGQTPFGGLLYTNGVLYGVTMPEGVKRSTVFSYDLTKSSKKTILVFQTYVFLQGPLVGSGNELFGTTNGALLRVDATNGRSYSFSFPSGSGAPDSGLLHVGVGYYGTTASAGTGNAGTVFKFVP